MTATEVTIVVKGTNNYFLEALLEEVQKNLKENGEDANVFFLDEMADEVEAAIQTLDYNNLSSFSTDDYETARKG